MDNTEILLQIQDLSFKPLSAEHNILNKVNLDINKGDFVLLLGPSGSGKSMLTRCLNGLIPHLEEGTFEGAVVVNGKNTTEHEIHEFATTLGIVFQNPDDQILSLKVIDEIAWGVENQGLPHKEIVKRVDEFIEMMEISFLRERLTFSISGGQKQRVSITANLVMLQDILVLDDPTTDLDPVGKREVIQTLKRLNQEMGQTLIVIENDLDDLMEIANRLVVMNDSGSIAFDGDTEVILAQHYDELVELGVNIPQHIQIARACASNGFEPGRFPVSKDSAFLTLKDFVDRFDELPQRSSPENDPHDTPIVEIRDLEFAYEPKVPVLRGIDLDIHKGELVALIGANGSGKSTLVMNLIGLLQPDSGSIIIDGMDTRKSNVANLARNIGYVFQNPDHQLFANTVAEEVGFSLKAKDVPEDEIQRRVSESLNVVNLLELSDRHPFSLSRGQRQQLAVATALVQKPSIVILDEPTTGQDRRTLSGLLSTMAELNAKGNTTIIVTHDMDIVAAYASRVIVMSKGQIVVDGHPEEIFFNNYTELQELELLPPTVTEYCRNLNERGFPNFLIVEELLDYIGNLKGGATHH